MKNNFSYFSTKHIWCGYLKELSQWDGSFEQPQQMFKLINKKYSQFHAPKFCLSSAMYSLGVHATKLAPEVIEKFHAKLNWALNFKLLIKTKISTNKEVSCF